MADLTLRDLPDATLAQIDLRAKSAGLSRQKYMLAHLTKTFGQANTLTGQIAARLHHVFDEVAQISFGYAEPKPTIATVAELLGHSDPAKLESLLAGDSPLAFYDAELLCRLLGINKSWLFNGDAAPYGQSAMFLDGMKCAQALANKSLRPSDGTKYKAWYFLLTDQEEGQVAVLGQSEENPYRFDLIISGVPFFEGVGAGGSKAILNFGLLCALVDSTMSVNGGSLLLSGFKCWGRLVDKTFYRGLVDGTKHPGHILSLRYGSAPWFEDFWDFKQTKQYSNGYAAAKDIFQLELAQEKITNNTELHAHLSRMLARWSASH
jgi:hypothetical protein